MDLSEISVNNLTGLQKEIAEVIGIDAYIKLVRKYGGDEIYIAKEDKIISMVRDKEIYRKFNGGNYSQLAREYNLAVRTVYEIIGRYINEKAQLSIFDDAENP